MNLDADPSADAAVEGLSQGVLRRSGAGRLGPHHLEFLRALIQGMRWDRAAELYLFGEPRVTQRSLIAQLRVWKVAFEKAAAIVGKPELVRALALARLVPQPKRGKSPAQLLTLEAWISSQVESFQNTAMLKEEYEAYVRGLRPVTEATPGTWNEDAALEALRTLTPLLAVPPEKWHPLTAWFHPRVAQRFTGAGITTVGDLVAFMNRHGHRWYSRIDRVGRQRAASIARWLKAETHAGAALTALATTPRTQLDVATLATVQTGRGRIAPLERVVVSPTLSGIDGSNRERRRTCQLDVSTDRDAIVGWLNASAMNENTFRAYRREAERVLQWCLYEKGKPLSSMTGDDATEYREFLVALPRPDLPWHWTTAREDWIGEKSHQRTSPNWRPFEGRMSRQSIAQSLRITRLLFRWLHEQAYLADNPWATLSTSLRKHAHFRTASATENQRVEGALSRKEWAALVAAVDAMPFGERRARAAALVRLGALAGLRREELACATTDWFKAQADGHIAFCVVGKGGVGRQVPVFPELKAAIGDYLEQRGLSRDPTQCPAGTPLLAKLADEVDDSTKAGKGAKPGTVALTPERIYAITRRLIERAADALDQHGEEKLAQDMRLRASASALRHTFGTQCAESDIPLPVLQAWMGHASFEATVAYFKPQDALRFDLIDKAFGATDTNVPPGSS